MESQPQNPEFRIKLENFHPCYMGLLARKPDSVACEQQRLRPACAYAV